MEIFPEDWSKALFIVAHPDDPEYGAAAAVARWTDQDKEVAYLLVTEGEAGLDAMDPAEAGPLRRQEQINAGAVVGVDTVEFLDGHADGTIEYGLPLRQDLALAIRRHQPEVVLGLNPHPTWGGTSLNMADHRNVGLAVMDACRDAANRWVFPEQLVDGLEPWTGVRFLAFAAAPEATHAVDVSETWSRGEESLAQHKTYLEAVGEPDFLLPMAEGVGQAIGARYGASWELYPL
jgi:LmbE family N-acetylglucosaminyl deacetylase